MNRMALPAIAAVLLSAIPASAGEWRHDRVTDYGRTTCSVVAEAGPLSVGFTGEVGGEASAFLGGIGLPAGAEMGLQVFGGEALVLHVTGTGEEISVFRGVPGRFLDELATGEVLTLSQPGAGGFAVSLSGSADELAAFRDCVADAAAPSAPSTPSITVLPAPSAAPAPVPPPSPRRRATVAPGAAYLPDRHMGLMPELEAAIELVATTHPGCVSIDNASFSPSRSKPGRWVFFVSCKMEGHVLPFQNVFVRDGVIYETSK